MTDDVYAEYVEVELRSVSLCLDSQTSSQSAHQITTGSSSMAQKDAPVPKYIRFAFGGSAGLVHKLGSLLITTVNSFEGWQRLCLYSRWIW